MYDCIYHYDELASSTDRIASSTCGVSTTSPANIATTSDIVILPTMSAGEVLIAFFLFVLILILIARSIVSALNRVETKKTVLGYSGGDVEVRNDI